MLGKVVLVVGCNFRDNIGEATRRKFVLEGATVITMDKMECQADYVCDASNVYDVANAFTAIKRKYGRLDAIMCCQGVNIMGKIENYSTVEWYTTIDSNLTSLFVILQAYVKMFDNDKIDKSFVVVTSDTSEIPKTLTFAYGASKAGANHFLRCAARELNKQHTDNWLVTGLAIGMVENTPMDKKTIADIVATRSVTPQEARKMLTNNIPLGRGLSTDEVAEWLYFVTTKGKYASGNILRIDGGQVQG